MAPTTVDLRARARVRPSAVAVLATLAPALTACGGGAGQAPAPTGPEPGGGVRPYEEVIPPGAETSRGLLDTHLVDERLYFEVPPGLLGQDLLLVVRSVEGGGGGPSRVLRWERRGRHLHLRERLLGDRADPGDAIAGAVERLARGPLVARLPIEAFGEDSAAVVEVTELFTGPVGEFGGLESVEADRSFVERAWAFPTNVEVEAIQTGKTSLPGALPGIPPETRTVRLHWSLMRLPRDPMMPRLHDQRIGFLSSTWVDWSSEEHGAERVRAIHRFRLEPSDTAAFRSGEAVDPVEPIVFWIDPATPRWLVPWVRRGVEAWQPAFLEAGFRNAILAREAPTEAEEPGWSLHDARHSAVLWRPSTVANAVGSHVVDPRSGEILKAEVRIFHNIMDLLSDWYVVQTAPLDPRARRLPLPDSLMGRLVQYVVSHEVGHALGLPHNMKSSAMYPVDSLRSADFLERMGGHVATLMDYSRFNYVAQPEDSIPPRLLIPDVGPYDRFAVRWGHRPILQASTPEEEREVLDRWARHQEDVPWLRFQTHDAPNDPHDLAEAVGDSDAVRASELGLRNLRRFAAMLLPMTERPGEDYELLEDLYGEMVDQWSRYMGHVAAVVGGAESRELYGTGPRFRPVDRARQREAVAFLNRYAFQAPDFLMEPDVLRRIEAAGAVDRIRDAQGSVVRVLLSPTRLERLVEYEALAGAEGEAYAVADLLADLRVGVWRELVVGRPRIGLHRRGLQRSWLSVVGELVGPDGGLAPESDVHPLLRGELAELAALVEREIPRSGDEPTRLHLRDVLSRIERILEGER